jgi:epoxide hydrolase-like predicted phosphatase
LECAVWETEANYNASIGKITTDELWHSICDNLKIERAQRRAVELAFWGGDALDTELLDFIRALRPRYKTALLSNAWSDLRRYITEELKIVDAFDEVVISAEVGLAKPDAQIFQLALDRLEVAAEEAIFIDDLLVNVEGARAVGLQAIQFRSAAQVKADLLEQLRRETPSRV